MPDKRLAIAFGLIGFISALLYAFTTPLWQAPDEPSHLGYIEHIDRVGALPSPLEAKIPAAVQAQARQVLKWPELTSPLPTEPRILAAEEFAYRDLMYTANHPPLYYLSARLFGRIGTVFTYDRLEGLAYGARVFSSLLVGLTVALAFLSARLVGLSRANSMLIAALLMLQPQYLFIGSSVNNDSMAVLWWSAFVYLMLREIHRHHPRHEILIGLVLGLGLLTKITFFLALPLTFVGFRLATTAKHRREAAHRSIFSIILAFMISGWWFVGNIFKYGSPWYVIGGSGLGPATWREFLTVSQFYRWLFKSYWGFFGWMDKAFPSPLYMILLIICIVAFVGVALTLSRKGMSKGYRRSLLFLILTSVTLFLGAIWFRIVAHTGQGRYLFPAIIPSTLLLWIGLQFWVPVRFKGWLAHATLLFFAGISAVGLSLIRQL